MAVAMDVDAVLADQQSRNKALEVQKEVELQLDLGNLLASDLNDLDTAALRYNKLLPFHVCDPSPFTMQRE